MCKCSATPKACLAGLSLIFWGVAGGLIFIGAWIFSEVQHVDEIAEAKYTLLPAAIIMACGIFLFILGIIGCVGAFKEQKCLLALFFSILLMIFVGQITAAALGYVYREQVDNNVKKGIMKGLDEYLNNSVIATQVDFMQSHLMCCGNDSYADWANTTWYKAQKNNTVLYPSSCCKDEKCDYTAKPGNNTQLYHKGCYHGFKEQFLSHLGIILGVGVAFALVQILGMVCSCVLICRRKTDVPYIGLNEPSGLGEPTGMRV